jgi:hypothetical protein
MALWCSRIEGCANTSRMSGKQHDSSCIQAQSLFFKKLFSTPAYMFIIAKSHENSESVITQPSVYYWRCLLPQYQYTYQRQVQRQFICVLLSWPSNPISCTRISAQLFFVFLHVSL